MHQDELLTDVAAAAGMLIFVTYASVQASQLGSATPSYNVYDSDNYPQVCPLQACTCDIKAAAHALHFMVSPILCTFHVQPKL